MLSDNERKIIRILFNHNRNEATVINIPRLSRLSQRTEAQVLRALNELAVKQFIEWDVKTKTVKVLYLGEEARPFKPWWELN